LDRFLEELQDSWSAEVFINPAARTVTDCHNTKGSRVTNAAGAATCNGGAIGLLLLHGEVVCSCRIQGYDKCWCELLGGRLLLEQK
jgi:hypothetical protein